MKSYKGMLLGRLNLVFSAWLLLGTVAFAQETNSIRMDVGPFFAPSGNASLEKAAAELPDILMVALSQENRFQLVERDKVNAIWGELHLAEAGLTSADTIGKFGKILACDWLVSGSFVQTGSGAQIWVKIINTQDSVVLDLQSVPFNLTNYSETTTAIVSFLSQARSRAQPREFIALGKFDDWSISATREDWSPRLVALIEKHFLAAGYGVVEREAVAPIFSEYQFQAAGLTASFTNRVRLRPAFWIVDGGCKWIHDTEDKLSVSIRIQKMGGREQLFSFTKPPGEELEKTVVDTVQTALANSGSTTAEEAQVGEEQIRAAHLSDLVKGRGEMPPLHYSANPTFITVTDLFGGTRQVQVDPVFLAQQKYHAEEMLKTLQQAILLNPNDMHAKYTLGVSLFSMTDAVQSKQGEDLLQEVAASDDAKYAAKAKNWLTDFKSGKLTFTRDQFGNLNIAVHGQPASIPVIDTDKVARDVASLEAKVAKLLEITNIAARADKVIEIQSPPAIAYLDAGEITACKVGRAFGKGPFLVACGTILKSFDWTGFFGPGSGTDFETVNLPLKIEQPITAIIPSDSDLWLGTDGGGLIKIPQSGAAPRVFDEKDGFPMSYIRSLRLVAGKLLIGFGHGNDGALGYLDTTTLKFTGMMSSAITFKTQEESLKSPPHTPVEQIREEDDNNFWVASDLALYHLKLDSQQWRAFLPSQAIENYQGMDGLYTLAVYGGFVVSTMSCGGVAVGKLSDGTWTHLNLSTNLNENTAATIAMDFDEPSHLWIGNRGKITILDLNTDKIIGECKMVRPGTIEYITVYAGDVFFVGEDQISGSYELYHLTKPTFSN